MINESRQAFLRRGLAELPDLPELHQRGRNGEELATDEAAVWKRVLDYRLAVWLKPARILETHGGMGIGTALYRHAAPQASIVALTDYRLAVDLTGQFDLIDVDPFGLPYAALAYALPLLAPDGVLLVSNGEALAVWRNLRRQQYAPTENFGRRLPRWVVAEYLPRLAALTHLPVRFFYAFPSNVRAVLCAHELPAHLWHGCQQWMWWLQRYANEAQFTLC